MQAGFRKGSGTRDQIVNIRWIREKAREFRKTSTSASLTVLKPLTVDHNKLWEILKEMGLPDQLTCLLRNLYVDQELDMEQLTISKLGKEYDKAVYCYPAYLTYMQSTLCEMPDWMNRKLESIFPGKISTSSDMQMIPL